MMQDTARGEPDPPPTMVGVPADVSVGKALDGGRTRRRRRRNSRYRRRRYSPTAGEVVASAACEGDDEAGAGAEGDAGAGAPNLQSPQERQRQRSASWWARRRRRGSRQRRAPPPFPSAAAAASDSAWASCPGAPHVSSFFITEAAAEADEWSASAELHALVDDEEDDGDVSFSDGSEEEERYGGEAGNGMLQPDDLGPLSNLALQMPPHTLSCHG
uniref:Uncharacterized protein n=1 Tax=Bicosoecida sp. CB-2014 TaxID=1486930 RepID=A0A7S1CIE6_9STRA|mmetsp:Transcript_28041/g.96993  ORF Transcript_28041/g.96993 Transcript_28041/m.96993 type:complete len:216 (+) Transcript_28041:387-1034(+)